MPISRTVGSTQKNEALIYLCNLSESRLNEIFGSLVFLEKLWEKHAKKSSRKHNSRYPTLPVLGRFGVPKRVCEPITQTNWHASCWFREV